MWIVEIIINVDDIAVIKMCNIKLMSTVIFSFNVRKMFQVILKELSNYPFLVSLHGHLCVNNIVIIYGQIY